MKEADPFPRLSNVSQHVYHVFLCIFFVTRLYVHTLIRSYIRTYIRLYIRTYIRTYIYTFITKERKKKYAINSLMYFYLKKFFCNHVIISYIFSINFVTRNSYMLSASYSISNIYVSVLVKSSFEDVFVNCIQSLDLFHRAKASSTSTIVSCVSWRMR